MDVVLEHRFFKGKNNNNQENFNHPFYDFDDYLINMTLEDSFLYNYYHIDSAIGKYKRVETIYGHYLNYKKETAETKSYSTFLFKKIHLMYIQ